MPTLNNDISFFKFYKTLNEAIVNEMPPVTELPEHRFIQMLPNETFKQITNCDTGVGFVGGMTAELVTCDGVVFQDITTNFDYHQVLVNGLNQIAFEFGYTGIDEPAKVFFLKLTDTTNDDVWFSYPFMITSYNQHISTKITYKSTIRKFGIPYDLLPYYQNIRIANMYRNNPANKKEVTQYTVSDGHQVNFDSRPTFLKRFLVSQIDDFINDRLDVAFSHEFVYIQEYGAKNIRAMVSEFKVSERQGSTNWLKDSEFLVNYQNEYIEDSFELLEPLQLISRYPLHNGVYVTGAVDEITGTFNKPITLGVGFIRLYKNNVLINTFDQTDITVTGNSFTLPITAINDSDTYNIQVDSGLFKSGAFEFGGVLAVDWEFRISVGDYDINDYDNIDYFTN